MSWYMREIYRNNCGKSKTCESKIQQDSNINLSNRDRVSVCSGERAVSKDNDTKYSHGVQVEPCGGSDTEVGEKR